MEKDEESPCRDNGKVKEGGTVETTRQVKSGKCKILVTHRGIKQWENYLLSLQLGVF